MTTIRLMMEIIQLLSSSSSVFNPPRITNELLLLCPRRLFIIIDRTNEKTGIHVSVCVCVQMFYRKISMIIIIQ